MKKVGLIILLIAIIVAVIAVVFATRTHRDTNFNEDNPTIIVTSFIAYDVVREVAGEHVNLINLLAPGVEMHSFDPSPADIIRIQNADMFIYVGGQMEQWTTRVLETANVNDVMVVRLIDAVELLENPYYDHDHSHSHDDNHAHSDSHSHSHSDDHGHSTQAQENGQSYSHVSDHGHSNHDHSHDHDHSHGVYDEHIWTSPENVIRITQFVTEALILLDNTHEEEIRENAARHIAEIRALQVQIREIVENGVRTKLVVGDRMPMQYFLSEFGLTASAAFSGCSTDVEPSASHIADLVRTIREERIPVVLYLELGTGRLARTIADEVGVPAMQLHSFHNVSVVDFNNGETFVSLMTRNLAVLEYALH